jgi:hypothetical protein
MFKTCELFKEWYESLPQHLKSYAKNVIIENLEWSESIFQNKLSRTPLTRSEQIHLNDIAGEKIFDLDSKRDAIKINTLASSILDKINNNPGDPQNV